MRPVRRFWIVLRIDLFRLAESFAIQGDQIDLVGSELTEFRQPLQVQSHLEMPRILVQLGHTQRT